MDNERSKPPYNKQSGIPKNINWQSLLAKDGADLEVQYMKTLAELGKQEGIIGVIFRKAQNKIQDPAKLRRIIADLIDKENWLPVQIEQVDLNENKSRYLIKSIVMSDVQDKKQFQFKVPEGAEIIEMQ